MAGNTRTDAQIQRDVLARLRGRVVLTAIEVRVKDGVVTVTGWANTHTQVIMATPDPVQADSPADVDEDTTLE